MPRGKLRTDDWSIALFKGDFIRRAEVCHRHLRNSASPPEVEVVLVGGIVQYLGLVDECLAALNELVPRIDQVRQKYKKQIQTWRLFRDDAAHVADRLFRKSIPGMHESQYRDERAGLVMAVLRYDKRADVVSTGAPTSKGLRLSSAISRAKAISRAADEAVWKHHHAGETVPRIRGRRVRKRFLTLTHVVDASTSLGSLRRPR